MMTVFALTSLFNLSQWTFFTVSTICNFPIRTFDTTITIFMWNSIKRTIFTFTIHCNFISWTFCTRNTVSTWNLTFRTTFTMPIGCIFVFWTLDAVSLVIIWNFSRHSTRLTHTILSDLTSLAGHAHHPIHCWNLSIGTF